MDGSRSALIIASDTYTDPGLRRLRAPAGDAQALAAVLRDPAIGGFEVRTLLNAPAHEVNLAVEEFFADRTPDDLLLVHFSCHGIKDEGGELYFATANTRLRRLGATAVAAEFVNRRMSRSRSRRVVLLLDCCYAGAFERGMTARAGTEMAIEEQFGGRGRAVITASSAMEYAFEGDQLADTQELQPSVFTSALVAGLETGDADRDQDGLVGLDELYDYVYDTVRATTPNQTPGKWTFAVQGDLVIARRARPVTTPAPLPPELQQAIDSPLAGVRAGAVQELARLLQARHAGLVLAARLTLERLANDDSRTVAAAAAEALGAQAQPAPPKPAPPRLALSATVVDFGRLPQHSKSPERRVRLGNAGGGTLNARVATSASWLQLRQVGDELVIAVDTTAAGGYDGVVSVDSDAGSATVRVQAHVDPTPPPAPGAARTTHPEAVPAAPERDRPQEQRAFTDASQASAPAPPPVAAPAPALPSPGVPPAGPATPGRGWPASDSGTPALAATREQREQAEPSQAPGIPPAAPATPATTRPPSDSDSGKPPGPQRRRLSTRSRILAGAGVVVVLISLLIVAIVANSETTPSNTTGPSPFLKDDFSSRGNDWDDAGSKRAGGHHSNGAYRISAEPGVDDGFEVGIPRSASNVILSSFPRLSIAVEARRATGSSQDVRYGIFCRSDQVLSRGYAFAIENQSVVLAKRSGSDDVKELWRGDTSAINADGINRLDADCNGDDGSVYFNLYLNGELVFEYTDSENPLPNGTVGLFVEASREAKTTVEAEFDNFVLTQN